MELNINKLATTNGYNVKVDRHGVYTNYILTNRNGIIRIERSAVKGHPPIIIRANYKIEIPSNFSLFYSDYSKAFTIGEEMNENLDYAKLSENDIEQIIINNK